MLLKSILIFSITCSVISCSTKVSEQPASSRESSVATAHNAVDSEHPPQPRGFTSTSAPTHATEALHPPEGSGAGFTPLHDLMAGNKRFVENRPSTNNQGQARRKELVSGQKPKAIVLSCSDSRVPPELVFDQGLGDIFVVRSAGEVADPVGLASIEYAVEHLGTKLIVVMGHEACGAVKAAIGTPVGKSAGSPSLDTLVAQIRPHLIVTPGKEASADLDGSIRSHVDGVAKKMLEQSKILHHAHATEGLVVVKGLYHLDTGRVEFWL